MSGRYVDTADEAFSTAVPAELPFGVLVTQTPLSETNLS